VLFDFGPPAPPAVLLGGGGANVVSVRTGWEVWSRTSQNCPDSTTERQEFLGGVIQSRQRYWMSCRSLTWTLRTWTSAPLLHVSGEFLLMCVWNGRKVNMCSTKPRLYLLAVARCSTARHWNTGYAEDFFRYSEGESTCKFCEYFGLVRIVSDVFELRFGKWKIRK
jgi:hypothetical protein